MGTFSGRSFTPEEDRVIAERYSELGDRGLSRLLGVSNSVVRRRRRQIGVESRPHLWTDPENDYLRRNYLLLKDTELAAYFSRSIEAVINQRVRLQLLRSTGDGLHRKTAWTQADDDRLRDEYGSRSRRRLAHDLGCTVSELDGRARELGVTKPASEWTAVALEILHATWRNTSDAHIGERLGRSSKAVAAMRHRLGLVRQQRFSATEDARISAAVGDAKGMRDPLSRLAAELGRSPSVVSERARRLGLSVRSAKGRRDLVDGYRSVGHHQGRIVFEHREVMKRFLGRELTSEEIVHHINGNRSDNRLENLLLCANPREHRKVHDTAWELVRTLIQAGAVQFNKQAKAYELTEESCQLLFRQFEQEEAPVSAKATNLSQLRSEKTDAELNRG